MGKLKEYWDEQKIAEIPEQKDIVKGLSDEALMDLVQRQTLKYFWDYAHPVHGLARERRGGVLFPYDQDTTVTTGGTGFGIMALIAGVERGWLPRRQVMERVTRIVGFLERCEKLNGVFPHYIDATTGKSCHFNPRENGGDIVETAFLMTGLLTARQYFSSCSNQEKSLRNRINQLWRDVDWSSHQKEGTHKIQWINHPVDGLGAWPVTGWNEALITHILAAASPIHLVSPHTYEQGWACGDDYYKNGQTVYDLELPLGPSEGGPLFFAHYSFLGLDPRGLKDRHADYWLQNKHHTLINHAHCVVNPHNYKGYGAHCWGLTASDSHDGYHVHTPRSDLGVISPTAALSSFPYTPEYSMKAMRHFYENMGEKIWGPYGFVDGFNETQDWYAESYLAIDQGPIVVMIENHRSGLLWELFMSCPEIKYALNLLHFESPHLPGRLITASLDKTVPLKKAL